MKVRLIFIGLFIILAVSNCRKDHEKLQELNSFSIEYKRASSWVNYSYAVTIDHSGLLKISEDYGISDYSRDSEYKMTTADILLIKSKLDTLMIIDLKDKYGFDFENSPTDLPVTSLIYKTNTRSDSCAMYYPKENEMPAKLDFFLITIEQMVLKYDTFAK